MKVLKRTIPRMIEIRVQAGKQLWAVNADPIQVEQVLLNMGSNAADAMPQGGQLLIETCNVTLDDDFTTRHMGAHKGQHVLMRISDTGCGMNSETVAQVFEPFFTTKEVGKGTGLGLASVYGIVKAHGGYIQCYSEINQGTTFNIYWPALPDPESSADAFDAPSSDAHQPVFSTRRATILVVDDVEAIRSTVQAPGAPRQQGHCNAGKLQLPGIVNRLLPGMLQFGLIPKALDFNYRLPMSAAQV